jgi:hypothetical protein
MIRGSSIRPILAMSSPTSPLPSRYAIGDEIDWEAPWIDVSLRVELPFWLMVNDTTVSVTVEEHAFEIAIHENYYELHGGKIADSKISVFYQGPPKPFDQLSERIQEFATSHPDFLFLWRKCKTVLKIKSRCNEDVWKTANEGKRSVRPAIHYYLTELCRAHIPVINALVQGYRLATYDYFPFEVSPWDVPFWLVESDGHCVRASLVPYRGWDEKPRVFEAPFSELAKSISEGQKVAPPTLRYDLIDETELQNKVSLSGSPGEFELLDALNLMERGDYSGAVRRVTTSIEVIVESVVGASVEAKEGKRVAVKFLKETETNFPRRVDKYQELSGRSLPNSLRTDLLSTRKLRHRIVHKGYRIGPNERGRAQSRHRKVDF